MVTMERLIEVLENIAYCKIEDFDHSADIWDELNDVRDLARDVLREAGVEVVEDDS